MYFVASACDRALASSTASRTREELHARLSGKHEQACILRMQIQQARLEVKQLRLRLQAFGVTDPTFVPSRVQAGSGANEPHNFELQSLLQWLVETVDLTQQVVFECGSTDGDVMVGGRRVVLHRMAAWRLATGSAAGLRLSVPLDLQVEISGMLAAARKRGRVDEAQVQRLADSWEVVGAEVVSATVGHPQPAIFLVHRESAQAMVVAHWPMVEFASSTFAERFDPAQHFARLAGTSPCSPASATASSPQVSTGDRVEVEYEGQWFTGVIQWVDGDIANVKCDVDSPGVITVAPLTSVRPARPSHVAETKRQRNMRARSVG